jgi:hypothetical protein
LDTTYRVFFRDEDKAIVGRDEFHADDDGSAMVISHMIADACADRCAEFELWQGSRRVDRRLATGSFPSAEKIAGIVIEREMAIRDSRWTIADSKRLLEKTSRLVKSVRGSRALKRAVMPAPFGPDYWRERAEEARAQASQSLDPSAKRTMLEIAENSVGRAGRGDSQDRLVADRALDFSNYHRSRSCCFINSG